jgi:DNA-binding transcriptional LysR family regulator
VNWSRSFRRPGSKLRELNGIGISILPESVKSVALEGVVYRPIRHPDAVVPLMLAFRESENAAAVSRFVAHVRKVAVSQA